MKEGDKIIWDSGFGYDIGEFKKISMAHSDSFIIVLRSGNSRNAQILVSSNEVTAYSDQLAEELSKKYSCILKSFKN